MKIFLIFTILLSSLMASESAKSKKDRLDAQIKKEMQKEKKYAREQTFYSGADYDFKGAEVNKDSLDSIPNIEVDDFDMDSVYD